MSDSRNNYPERGQKRRYARRKGQQEQITAPENLREEIAMLRILMRRVMAMADDGHPLPDLLRMLECVSKASTRLGTLLKTERLLDDERHDMASTLNQALAEVIEELDVGNV